MCFAPHVSLATAVIEFTLGIIILLKFRKSVVSRFGAALVFVLGLYQLIEFMFCITDQRVLWATIGFITYTFLPAIGLHFAVRFVKLKINTLLIYLPAVIFGLISLLATNFITGGSCHTIFISVDNVFFPEHIIVAFFYALYYSSYILVACFLMWKKYFLSKNKEEKRMTFILLGGLLIVTIPATILMVIFPMFDVVFASMYCEFSLVFAIMISVAAYLDYKYKLS